MMYVSNPPVNTYILNQMRLESFFINKITSPEPTNSLAYGIEVRNIIEDDLSKIRKEKNWVR